jgi:hypothetical protein
VSRRGEGGRAAKRKGPAVTLSAEWRAWLAENALAGASEAELLAALRQASVPAAVARSEVAALLSSPLRERCREALIEGEQLDLVCRMLRQLARSSPHAGRVERRARVDAGEFFAHYFAACRPVILTEMIRGWPAVERWTPASLAGRFGHVSIEVTDRGPGSTFEWRVQGLDERIRMTLGEFVDRITTPGAPPDRYLEASNRALESSGLAPLLEDLAPPADLFDPAHLAGGVSLWFGPGGTFTPLHHDTTNILFCQVYGRKRLRLVSPLETSLLAGARGFWAAAPLDELLGRPEHADLPFLDIELSADEALFLPCGWWHEVEALEPSIHLSVMHFRQPNDLSFYRPGHARFPAG